MAQPVVLILGCGVSGVVVARTVRQLLPSKFRVITVDREVYASYAPAYLRIMTGERRPESIRRHRGRLARHGIEFVNAEVRQIDLDDHYVRADNREFHYDYLVLALGAEPVFSAHSEVHHLETLEGAEHLAASLRYFSGGRIIIASSSRGFRYPPLPYEMAMLLEDYFHSRKVRQKVIISLYTPEESPLAVLAAKSSNELGSLLAHKGIEVRVGQALKSVNSAQRVATMVDGEEASFQMLITEPPFQTAPALIDTGMVDASGRIPSDPITLETARENVFVAGDATYLTLPDGRELPHAPGIAARQAQVIAHNIAFRNGVGPRPDAFDAKARWLIEAGNGSAMTAEGDFLASPRQFTLKQPSKIWHLANLAQERYWLWHWY